MSYEPFALSLSKGSPCATPASTLRQAQDRPNSARTENEYFTGLDQLNFSTFAFFALLRLCDGCSCVDTRTITSVPPRQHHGHDRQFCKLRHKLVNDLLRIRAQGAVGDHAKLHAAVAQNRHAQPREILFAIKNIHSVLLNNNR